MRRLTLAVAVVTAGVASCSVAYSFDGLTAGPEVASRGGADAAADAAAAPCPPSAILCDDFENGFDTSKWQENDIQGGSSATDGVHAHRGRAALHSHTGGVPSPAAAAGANIDTSWVHTTIVTLPFPATIYSRVFVYLPAQPVVTDVLPTFLSISRAQGGEELAFIDGKIGMIDWFDDTRTNATSIFPTDRWICVEWETAFGQGGRQTVWVDEERDDAVSSMVNLPDANFLKLGTNFNKPTSQPAYDIWFDDLVVDVNRVGCSR